jgi:heptosyltransferase-2
MKLGVFLPNWIGDVVMATPALRALRRHLGRPATLLGIMRPYVADVLAGTAWLDGVLLYDPRARESALGMRQLVQRLRQERLDAVVLLTNSLRTGLLAWLSSAPRRVGYERYGRGWLLTDRLQPPQSAGKLMPHPMVDYYLELAYALGCPPESPRLELATLPSDERCADLAWSRLGLGEGSRVVVLNAGGAYGAAKHWPAEHCAKLARRIATHLDHDVLVLCGPSERQTAAEIVRQAGHPRVASLADEPLSIGLSKACIRRSRLLVTTDSGPRHLAAAFGLPIIGLYGPTLPVWGANSAVREVSLHVALDCLGCAQRTCPLGHHRCMHDLSVDRVYDAVAAELTRRRESFAA